LVNTYVFGNDTFWHFKKQLSLDKYNVLNANCKIKWISWEVFGDTPLDVTQHVKLQPDGDFLAFPKTEFMYCMICKTCILKLKCKAYSYPTKSYD